MSSRLFIAKLVESRATRAVAVCEGRRIPISIALVPDAEIGDEVLVEHGFALRRMSEALESESDTGGEMDLPPGSPLMDL